MPVPAVTGTPLASWVQTRIASSRAEATTRSSWPGVGDGSAVDDGCTPGVDGCASPVAGVWLGPLVAVTTGPRPVPWLLDRGGSAAPQAATTIRIRPSPTPPRMRPTFGVRARLPGDTRHRFTGLLPFHLALVRAGGVWSAW